MDTVTEFLDKILFWHWGIVAVALGALEMLFAGGILMGAAIAALLVGAAALADQQFPGALPPEFKFGIVAQAATFLVLTFVFAVAMRLGRHRAAAMIAKASEKPAAPAQPAEPAEPAAPAAPMAVTPLVPTPPTAAPRSPQPPAQPLVSPPPPLPGAPAASLRPATARPIARPAGNQPMRVTGPTAVSQQPTPPPSAPRPVRPPPRPPAPVAQPAAPPPAPPPKPVAPAAKPRTPPTPPAAAAAPPPPAKPGVNPKDFVGKEYTLWKPVAGGKGTLRIAGNDWVLNGPDVAAGSRVRVVGVEGQTLRVEAAS